MADAIHDTFVLERTYPKPVERVFAAFADPAVKRRWFAEGHNNQVERFEMEFRVGGGEIAAYRLGANSPLPGALIEADGRHEDIVENRRIVTSQTMRMNGRAFSTALATIEFAPSGAGTRLILTHQAVFFEGADGPERRRAGWEEIFNRLAANLGN